MTTIGPERWQKLVSDEGYSVVATDEFPSLGVVVRTCWLGHDRENREPPRIFVTKAIGAPDGAEIASATERSALVVHAAMCARYRDQLLLIEDGGAPLLSQGVL